jgi:hypothetical protein
VQIQDRLIAALRRYCQALPDQRRGKNTTYAMTDFALAAFARFFMQSLSFLAHQRHLETGHGRSNCETLFDMSKIPRDNQIRVMLDPIEPALFYPLFADIVAELQQCGGLDAMRALDGHVLIAWDGTEYHCSNTNRQGGVAFATHQSGWAGGRIVTQTGANRLNAARTAK